MQISQSGLAFIKNNEGLSLKPYGDAAGHQTIGYGHLIKPNESFGNGIDQAKAEELLSVDANAAASYVNKWVTVQVNQNQFDALVDFVFNLGANAFHTSTLLSKLNDSNFDGAAAEFSKWVYAGGHVLPGLVVRRQKEKELFLS